METKKQLINGFDYDNIIIHFYPGSPYVASVKINVRTGSKVKLQFVMKDIPAAVAWMKRTDFYKLPCKVITHYAYETAVE